MSLRKSIVKIKNADANNFEAILAWPNDLEVQANMAEISLNFLGTWLFTITEESDAPTWSLKQIDTVTTEWLKIKSNALTCPKMKQNTLAMLSAILRLIWLKDLDFNFITRYQKVFKKAFKDFEALHLGGFLKLAFTQECTAIDSITVDGIIRKMRVPFTQCTVLILVRHKAKSEDTANFFTIANQIEELSKVKIILFNIL